ncbi:MAG: formate dehydrogenase subunit gamma [Alphaproteobacteria bacterium]|nr:formate dehydrogenase subunit gamma [Alphaproteobacteria bacterium]
MVVAYAVAVGVGGSLLLDPVAQAQQGAVPGGSSGITSDAELWREMRQGKAGNVSVPDKKAGVLIQSEGENWRALRNGPIATYGAWALLGMVIVLALFFALRGRIKIEAGASPNRILRFNAFDRFAHWLMASTFIVLALSGLNMLYGRHALKPLIGPDSFATITLWGKLAHNYLAFGFMAGLAMAFVLWVVHNFPNRYDLIWVAKLGGLFSKHSHPPAKKFNAGQKLIFWIVVLGGLSISLSGIILMFPFQTHLFADTFAIVNSIFGTQLQTDLTLLQEQQLAMLWHGVFSQGLIVVILGHIYIGTIGMQGAFDAMGSGEVDENWAREHHSVWVAEVKSEQAAAEEARRGDAPASPGKAPQSA